MVEIGAITAKILMTLSLCGWWWMVGGGGGGGGVKAFSCQTQLLSWVKVELGLWQLVKLVDTLFKAKLLALYYWAIADVNITESLMKNINIMVKIISHVKLSGICTLLLKKFECYYPYHDIYVCIRNLNWSLYS